MEEARSPIRRIDAGSFLTKSHPMDIHMIRTIYENIPKNERLLAEFSSFEEIKMFSEINGRTSRVTLSQFIFLLFIVVSHSQVSRV